MQCVCDCGFWCQQEYLHTFFHTLIHRIFTVLALSPCATILFRLFCILSRAKLQPWYLEYNPSEDLKQTVLQLLLVHSVRSFIHISNMSILSPERYMFFLPRSSTQLLACLFKSLIVQQDGMKNGVYYDDVTCFTLISQRLLNLLGCAGQVQGMGLFGIASERYCGVSGCEWGE